MTSIEDFFTRDIANEGIKIPLYLPTGEASEHWLMIRGIDSDAFRETETKSKQKIPELAAIESEDERSKALKSLEIDLLASLVISWSFDKECNLDNVKDLLIKAPQIADSINKITGSRKLFFALRSSASINI